MEIHLCPSCGTIVRNRAKFCAVCNAPISLQSLTTVQVTAQSTPPLTVPRLENKLILERTVNYLNYRAHHSQPLTADQSQTPAFASLPVEPGATHGNGGNGSATEEPASAPSPYGGSYTGNTDTDNIYTDSTRSTHIGSAGDALGTGNISTGGTEASIPNTGNASGLAKEQNSHHQEATVAQDDATQFKGLPPSLASNNSNVYETAGSSSQASQQLNSANTIIASAGTAAKATQNQATEANAPQLPDSMDSTRETGPAPWLVAASTTGSTGNDTNMVTPGTSSSFFEQNAPGLAAQPTFHQEGPSASSMVFSDKNQAHGIHTNHFPETNTPNNSSSTLAKNVTPEHSGPGLPPGITDFFDSKPAGVQETKAEPLQSEQKTENPVALSNSSNIASPEPEPDSGVFYTGDSFFDSVQLRPQTASNNGTKVSEPKEASFTASSEYTSGQPSIVANAIQAALNAKKAAGEDTEIYEQHRNSPHNGNEEKTGHSQTPPPSDTVGSRSDKNNKSASRLKTRGKAKGGKKPLPEEDNQDLDTSDDPDEFDDEDQDDPKNKNKKRHAKGKKLLSNQRLKTREPDKLKWLKIGAVLVICVGLPVIVLAGQIMGLVQSFNSLQTNRTGPNNSSQVNSQPLNQANNILANGPFGAFSGVKGTQLPADNLSGLWQIMFEIPNSNPTVGVMQLAQYGDEIRGSGEDSKHYVIAGMRKGNTISFRKQYVVQNKKHGLPILYQGQLTQVNKAPPYVVLQGIWKLEQKGHQFNWRQNLHQQSYGWQARLNTRFTPEQVTEIFGKTPALVEPNHAAGGGPTAFNLHQFVPFILIGLVVVGVGMWVFMTRIFGPSGIVNILAKKEYIPSQFKAEHYKMVAQLGKPPKPGSLPLGSRVDWNILSFYQAKTLSLPSSIREQNPHMLVLGAGAKGKSRLLASMIAADIASEDRAVIVIDSDGALVDLLVSWIAAHPKGAEWAERVVIIDPTHPEGTVVYNPLEFPQDGDLQNAASSIVFGFKAIYTEPPGSQSQWNQQTANILRNAAMLLMANGKTLTDLPVLLADNDFRDVLLEKIERQKTERAEFTTLVEAWTNYKRLARTDQWINWIEPILNRVQPMLSDARIRRILTNPQSDIDLKEVILNKNILFVKIPQGQLDQNGNLLGSLMVTGIKQAALSLSVRRSDKRRPCTLYLDEFDSFIEKETFDAISSETKKFQIGFVGASKTLQTLPEDYRSQLIINVGTMAVFALAKKDGDILGPQMFRVDGRKMKHQTMQNFFNRVNTSPQFELISDEEKLNIDRIVGQQERTYFCYRVGTVAGVFNLKAPDFNDPPENKIDEELIEQMYENRPANED